MYLHSASHLTGKSTLDVCISKCVYACVRARPCVRAGRARMCVHSFMCLTTVDVCVRLCLCIRHIGGMDVSILACMIFCVFLFSGHLHETKLELFSVWLVCHVFSDFDSRKNFKTEQERERARERERKREREREIERVIERERERERERETERERERWRDRETEREREREGEREGGGRERERERAG